ncbi:MAG: N-6 DNA methylase [Sedimentisphaerales bacterium]|nr:N-6 DNA methylase [Sedimentisphaerales bacterium]
MKKRGLPFTITQTYLGEEPAILFASHQRSESKRVVEQVALCAYHSAIEWGVVTNFSETVVFNSHWVKDNGWFRFPTIQSTNLLKCFDLLEALTPEGIRKNRIEELACSRSRPDHILVPVDDQLVDSLDTWRDEALRFSESPEAVDAKLQNLFAQLFILRAVEDRRLAPKIPLLSSCVDGNNSLDRRVIREIFDEARRHIQSELFESDIPKNIPDFILKGIIEDLYRPKNFPIRGVQYNFSWIEADVLGRAYEKYLSSVLVPSRQRDPQLFLFDQPLREVSRISRRKASGVYYTPDFVVRYLTEKSLDYFFDKTANKGKTKLPRVIDPSCGSGPFLRASADSLIRRLRQKDAKKNWGRELVKKRIIVGIDIDPKAITLARLSLWLRLAEEPDPLPLPHLKKNVVCGDSLRNTTWKNLPKTYDIVLGNPPFLAAAEAQVPEAVRKAFRSAQGRFDFSSLFIEQAVAKLKEGGYLGYVIPNRLFKNTYASEIRRLITENMRILTLVDFGSTEVFSGTSTYVGLILAEKDKDASRKKRIGVIEVNTLPFRFPGVTLVSGDVRYQIAIPNVKMYEAHHPNGEAPWNLLSDKAIGLRVQLQNANPTLGSLATVVQGIKTGANDIFVITIGKTLGSGLCEVTNGFGEHHLIEEGLLRPVVYGSEIQRYDVIDPQRFLLYPYSLNRPIPESDFRVQYPRTYEYLESYRDFLAVRSGIQNTSYGWYELVRKRQSSWLESKKILIRELATYPCFALDAQGGTYLIGGTAIVPINPGLLEPLLAYLNSSISGWYLEKSSPTFRGGYSKFEPSTIQQIPVPQVLIESDSFREKICDAVRELLRKHIAGDLLQQSRIENEIDDLFYKKLGISLDDID